MTPRRPVAYEQAVYGSFPFWDQGYAVLARSPGVRDEWLADFRAACQKLGERPAGVADPDGPWLFTLRLPSGPRAVVGVSPRGCDDQGRPGALAFHALFLDQADYERAGADPFAFAAALRSDWSVETRDLPSGEWRLDGPDSAEPSGLALRVASAIAAGRRVVLQSAGPVDRLARDVLRALPAPSRAHLSLATWAFGNGNRFDLFAAPRLAGLSLDESYVDAAHLPTPPGRPESPPVEARRRLLTAATVAAAVLAIVAVGLAFRSAGGGHPPAPATKPAGPTPKSADRPPADPGPDPRDDDPDARADLSEALAGLAERFGVEAVGAAGSEALMERLDAALRYRGPLLTPADLARLNRDPDRDAALALRWDAHVRRFAPDRPLPDDFRRRTPRGQVAALGWSFHLDPGQGSVDFSRLPAGEAAQALGESLAVDTPLHPTPLSRRDPTLAAYLTFLARLPRR